jgi:archaellum component FlaC
MANLSRPSLTSSEMAPAVREVLERLERIETRIEDLQTLVDLQLETTADIRSGIRDIADDRPDA